MHSDLHSADVFNTEMQWHAWRDPGLEWDEEEEDGWESGGDGKGEILGWQGQGERAPVMQRQQHSIGGREGGSVAAGGSQGVQVALSEKAVRGRGTGSRGTGGTGWSMMDLSKRDKKKRETKARAWEQ